MKITDSQVQEAYRVAQEVFSGEIKSAEGSRILHSEHGLNQATATDFIITELAWLSAFFVRAFARLLGILPGVSFNNSLLVRGLVFSKCLAVSPFDRSRKRLSELYLE